MDIHLTIRDLVSAVIVIFSATTSLAARLFSQSSAGTIVILARLAAELSVNNIGTARECMWMTSGACRRLP